MKFRGEELVVGKTQLDIPNQNTYTLSKIGEVDSDGGICCEWGENNTFWIYEKDQESAYRVYTDTAEYTGKSVSYYSVDIKNPTSAEEPYVAECNDIIEALGMNYAEGNAFKSIWRRCAARKLGKSKKGYGSGLYDAEKGVFFAERILIQAQEEEDAED